MLSAVAVISVRNPVHAVLLLVLTFFSVACIWILAGAEFLGIALVLVYVGAVMVLFLFVVMMLDIDVAPLREGFVRYLPVGLLVAVVMLVEMLALIGVKARSARRRSAPTPRRGAPACPNTTWLARALFTDFLLPFEVAAVILTVAVVAAVMLTLRRRVGAKHQDPARQVARRAARPPAHGEDGRREAGRTDRRARRPSHDVGSPGLGHYLALGAVLFCISVAGIFLNRKNVIVLLMSHRADAARGQHQLRRVLALPRRRRRAGVRVLHPDRGRGRGRDRPGDPGHAVPQPAHDQRRRNRHVEGLTRCRASNT